MDRVGSRRLLGSVGLWGKQHRMEAVVEMFNRLVIEQNDEGDEGKDETTEGLSLMKIVT